MTPNTRRGLTAVALALDVLDEPSMGWLIFFHSSRGSRKEYCKTNPQRLMKVDRLRMSSKGWPFVNGSSKPSGR